MKQKLGLCCALVHDPDLLILDEPTTGVDPLSRRQFWELIDRIRERRPGMSVLVADRLYGRGRGLRLADRDGRRHGDRTGTPEEVNARPRRATSRMPSSHCCPRRRGAATASCVIPPLRGQGGDARHRGRMA